MDLFTSEIHKDDFFKTPETETGWERLKMMYNLERPNAECYFIVKSGAMSFATGMVVGAMLRNRHAQAEFIRKNQATAFNAHIDANRKMNDKVLLDMAWHGWRFGWRLALFCGGFSAITTTIAVYRNKASIGEQALAGCIVGGMWKMNLGLKATLVGSIVGGALGALSGLATVSYMWLSGTSVEQMRYWNHAYYEKRLRARQEELQKNRDESALPTSHNKNDTVE